MREPTGAREELERRWRSRLSREDSLARLVTADDARIEPYHRWLPFRQGFSPGLVRRFLAEVAAANPRGQDAPVLDPFSGAGTTVVECARAGVIAAGIEASPALTFLTNAKFEHPFPAWTSPATLSDWRDVASDLTHPLHRAALMLAVARQHSTAGRPNPAAPPLEETLANVIAMMRDDFRRPLGFCNAVTLGDARQADGIEDDSVRAILTSPPYLSRYDYAQITAPIEEVHRFWYSEPAAVEAPSIPGASAQRPASTKGSCSTRRGFGSEAPGATSSNDDAGDFELDAVGEVRGVLHSTGERKLCAIVGSYFSDLRAVLRQCHRALRPSAPAWFVIGGARLKGSYVPSDLIFAELAEQEGFAVESLLVARDLIHARRKFGASGHVAPRESVVALIKA